MKKILKIGSILIYIFLFQFLFIQSISAKSGCCSGHGGVSCSAGAQSNGKVICNDGWTGSSCLYSEMVMCGGSSSDSDTPQNIPPTKTATRAPTRIPTRVPTPTALPTTIPTETLSPTSTETPILTSTPTSTPVVLGAETKNTTQSSSNGLGTIAILAWIGFGVYKLINRFKK